MTEESYMRLQRRVEATGLLERRPLRYLPLTLACLALFAAAIWALARWPSVWMQVAAACVLGFVNIQFGLLMHDAGHRQIFKERWKNDLAGLLFGDVLAGLAFGWWMPHHNHHHANPNDPENDPDVRMLRIALALTEDDAARARGLMRWVAKYQVFLLPFMFSAQGFGLKWYGLRFLLTRRSRWRWLELGIILLHHAVYGWFLWTTLGTWGAVRVALVHHLVGGFYMASVLAPNHIGLPLVDPNEKLDHLRLQVVYSRNVRARPWADFWFGALNYQIEHHLFPAMPRGSMRRCTEVVRAYCHEQNVIYRETTMAGAYREIVTALHRVGAPARRGSGRTPPGARAIPPPPQSGPDQPAPAR